MAVECPSPCTQLEFLKSTSEYFVKNISSKVYYISVAFNFKVVLAFCTNQSRNVLSQDAFEEGGVLNVAKNVYIFSSVEGKSI